MRGVPAPVVVLLLLVPGAGATFQERAMEADGQPVGLHSIPIYFDVPLAPGSGVRQEPSTKLFTVPPPEVQAAIKGLTCQVSQDHLRRYLTTLQEFGTRFCAAPQMALATRWLHDTLDGNGRLQVSFHNFTYQGQVNTYLMSNVILTLPGLNRSSDAVYYFYAHSDSVSQDYWNNAPGADDDGSGCVAVLEAARILSRYDFQDTIKFCFFTAEEIGLVGSGRYVESIHSMGENVQGGICYDMVGSSYAGGTYDFNLAWDPASAPQGRYMVGVNERYGIGLRIDTYQYPAGQGAPTDITRFWQHGYPGVFGIEEDFSPYYHSTMDRVEYINFTLVQRATMLAIASLAEMARFMYVDLSIPPDGLRLSSERPEEGEDVEISVNVTNTGNLNATDVDVEFYVDGLPIAARRVDVPAGATSSTEARWRAAAGTHRVTVEIDPRNNVVESDESNNTAERFVEVNDRPVAFLSASPLSVLTQEEVRFDGGSSVDAIGGVSEYSFDFGDGSGTGWTPSARAAHSYGNDGVYTASLRVRDALGSVSGPSRINITVLNRAPSASPSANSTRALTLVPIKFFSNASDQDGSVTVRWSFGDGCETDELDPVHVYTNSGSYDVLLNVTDDDGSSSIYRLGIIVSNRPPACFIEVPEDTGDITTEFTFTARANDPDGRVVAVLWDLGDGETDPRWSVAHSYDRPGRYTIRLIVKDDDGSEATAYTIVEVRDRRPVARAMAHPEEVSTFRPVLFFGGDSSDLEGPVVYLWDFGDGNVSSDASPRHAYTRPGSYAPSLTVMDSAGQTDTFYLEPVRVVNRRPIAAFRAFGCFTEGREVYFDATSSSDPEGPVILYWSFGDGTHAGGPVVEHVFLRPGNYTVELTVVDDYGESSAASLIVTIEPLPPLPPPPKKEPAPENRDWLVSLLGALGLVLMALLVLMAFWGLRWRARAAGSGVVRMEGRAFPPEPPEAEPWTPDNSIGEFGEDPGAGPHPGPPYTGEPPGRGL